eukprot:m.343671 g.343671  ORF g.343671 m.343671 type:complete len:904 (-) comp23124_c0_seq1:145-2856(-)
MLFSVKILVIVTSTTLSLPPLQEPWQQFHGGEWGNATTHKSNVDPLAGYSWSKEFVDNVTADLQVFPNNKPVEAQVVLESVPGSFLNVPSLVNAPFGEANVVVKHAGTIRVDFGHELPGWLELSSRDLSNSTLQNNVQMSISEMSVPQNFPYAKGHTWKTDTPVAYANGLFRLELNSALYEGVRFGFIHVKGNLSATFTINGIRCVHQIKPINWEGSFNSSNDLLNKIWYAGAWTVKTNVLKSGYGAILDDRGDRDAFAGDDHVTQGASMVAFRNYAFVNHSLFTTMTAATNFYSYSLLWVLSVVDYWNASGDQSSVLLLLTECASILDTAAGRVGKLPKGKAAFIGWDERVGGFGFVCNLPENNYTYWAMFVEACRKSSEMAKSVGNMVYANKYSTIANQETVKIRAAGATWWSNWGIHACSRAITAGIPSKEEQTQMIAARFMNSAKICSVSNFNQLNIAMALTVAGRADLALATILLCWGAEIKLGATSFWEISGYGGQWLPALQRFIDNPESENVHPPPLPAHSGGSNSLCHPWSAGATTWLTHYGLGIRPRSPGFTSITVQPVLDVVQGAVPTPRGTIKVDINALRGYHKVEIPRDTHAELYLPVLGRELATNQFTVTCTRKPDQSEDTMKVPCLYHVVPTPWTSKERNVTSRMSTMWVHVNVSTTTVSSSFKINIVNNFVSYEQEMFPTAIESDEFTRETLGDPQWDTPLLFVDNETLGNWSTRYGSLGYILFGLGKEAVQLPSWVSLSLSDLTEGTWNLSVTPDNDKFVSALELSRNNTQQRGIGSVHTGTGPGCFDLAENRPTKCLNLSLYQIDWDGEGSMFPGEGKGLERRQALDMITWNVNDTMLDIGYATAVADGSTFKAGQYLTFRICQSIRVRLYPIYGDNAVISAFFLN